MILLEMIVGRTIISANNVNVSKDIVSKLPETKATHLTYFQFLDTKMYMFLLLVPPQLSVSLTADSIARKSIIDPTVHKECSDDSVKTLIELCVRCLSKEPYERPSVEDVIWNLQFAAQVHESWNRGSPVHAS